MNERTDIETPTLVRPLTSAARGSFLLKLGDSSLAAGAVSRRPDCPRRSRPYRQDCPVRDAHPGVIEAGEEGEMPLA